MMEMSVNELNQAVGWKISLSDLPRGAVVLWRFHPSIALTIAALEAEGKPAVTFEIEPSDTPKGGA
jgi:hypothetical protein